VRPSVALAPPIGLRRRPEWPWRRLDPALAGASLALTGLGTLMILSVTRSAGDGSADGVLARQGVIVACGLAAAALAAGVDYRRLRRAAPFVWLGAVVLLAAVLSPLGAEVNGSQSWFAIGPFQLQPSEPAKLAVIIALAAIGASEPGWLRFRRVAAALVVAAVPALLIFSQPDLGTALVFAAVLLGVLLVAGARARHLALLTALGAAAVAGTFLLTDLVEDYQRDRLSAFATEGGSGAAAGYSLEQAKTAIASGGVRGAGLFEGVQTKGRFVPEQQTDFIFTVVGEELGFVGAASLLALYGVMVWRVWRTAAGCHDALGRLLCAGVLALLVFQVFENVGMTLGIMPITGIPLPLLSYGGSSFVTTAAAVGLVLNVGARS
jgi:rod shape determining protein RodA